MEKFAVEIIRTEEGLRGLQSEWSRLHQAMVPRNPFLSWEWSINYWDYLCPPCSPFIIAAWHGEQLVGLLPLRLELKWGFRHLRFLGDDRSDYLGLLIAPGHEAAGRALTDCLYQHKEQWDCCFFRKLHDGFPCPELPPGDREFRVVRFRPGSAPYLRYSGSWDELCISGPSQIRQAQRKLKKFRKDGGTVERFSGDDSASLVEQVTLIESRSWKMGTDTLRFQSQREQHMLAHLLSVFGARDEIELWIARLRSEPAAFLINFLTPERTCFYQTAYQQAYQKYSPGTILCLMAMERTWREGLHEFDFMGGNEPFKQRWTNQRRDLKKALVMRKSLRGHLGALVLIVSRAYEKLVSNLSG